MLHRGEVWLKKEDIMGIARVMLKSRALEQVEMADLLSRFVQQSCPEERKAIKEIIRNEQYHYQSVQREKTLLPVIWELSEATRQQ